MEARFQSRSWSSATFTRGLCLANGQRLDLEGVEGMPRDDELLAMREELQALEALANSLKLPFSKY